MTNTVYAEWVPTGKLVKGLVVMIVALVGVISFSTLFFGGVTAESISGVAVGWGVLAFIALLIWNYRGIHIQVSRDKLTVRYGVFNKKSFLLKEITYCKRTRANLGRYFGVGVRYGTDGSIAYSTSFGDAVEIGPKEGKVFVFSSNRPDQVCRVIQQAQATQR